MPKGRRQDEREQVRTEPHATIASLAVWSLAHGLWRYTNDQLKAIDEVAPRPLTREEIDELECCASDYCRKLPILTRPQANEIRRLAMELAGELNSLSTAKLHDIERRVRSVREIHTWALSHVEQRRSNRARPTLDGYIARVALFYVHKLGGVLSQAPKSACAKFIRVAVTPVITATGGEMKAINKIIESRLWLEIASEYTVGSPEIGQPRLTVIRQRSK